MNVLDVLAGQLAVQRQLLSEATLHQVLQHLSPGANLGESLLRQGLISSSTLQELQTDVRQARLLCPGCGLTARPDQLNPQSPLNCGRCQTTLILATGRDSRFDTTPGTGQFAGPTATGSNRRPRAETPQTFVSTTSGSAHFGSGSGRLGSGSPRAGSGSARFPGGADPSGSMRFRHALEKPGGRVGDFELLEELGRGGMGVVYKARHLGRNEQVALKVLLAGALASKRQLKRFEREISAMTQLDHPNIVTVKDVGSFGDNPFFTMELVEGRPLGDLIRSQRLSFRRSAEIAREVALGLEHAHRADIVHRDIKPDNILIELSGAALITDFGLVRHMDDDSERMTRSGALVGTPYYMSPEQARGKRNLVSGKTDIYALGVVLYYMVCGELPFNADTQMELISKIVSEPPVPPSTHKPGVPASLDRIVLNCMAKDLDARYDTAADLAEDLERYLEGRDVLAQAPRTGAGKSVLMLVIGLLALTLIGLPSAWWVVERRRAEERRLEEERLKLEAQKKERAKEAARLASLDAVKKATAAVNIAPTGPRYRLALATLLQTLTTASAALPDDAGLALQRGRTSEALHLFDSALADYARAWKLDAGGRVGTEALVRETWLRKRSQPVDTDALAKTLADALPSLGPESGAWRATLQAWHALVVAKRRDEMLQAMSFATDARRKEPSNATAWAMEATAAMLLGQSEPALNAIRMAIELEPRVPLHLSTRAMIRSMTDDMAGARSDLAMALLLDPELTEALNVRSTIRAQRGDLVGAISDLERVIKAEPHNGDSLVMLARVYRMDNQLEKCDALLARGEKVAPNNPEVYDLKVRLHLERAELDDALLVLRRGIAKLKDETERRRLHDRLLELADETQRFEILRSYADERLDASPTDAWGLEALGDLAADRGRWKEAAEIFRRCIRQHPNFPEVWEKLLGALVRLKTSKAELHDELERFLGRFPENSVALCAAAQFYLGINQDLKGSRALALKATEVNPQSSVAWSTLALVEALSDRLQPAYEAALRATILDPQNYRAHHIIGEVRLKQDKVKLALQRYSRALSINPFYTEAVQRVAMVLLSQNRNPEATKFIERHIKLLQAARRRPTKVFTIHRMQALFATGRTQLASNLLEQVLQDPPTAVEDRRYLAIVLINIGRVDEGRAILEQIRLEAPDNELIKELLDQLDEKN